ncbi:MAG: L,D-transpeptidase [Methylococcales bacterium]
MNALKISFFALLVLSNGSVALANPLVEDPLKQGISAVVAQNVDQGIDQIDALAKKYPNFKLAQYVKADLLSYRSGQHFNKNFKNAFISSAVYGELEARLKEDDVVKQNLFPSEVVYLGQQYANVLVADISRSRLYVYDNKLSLINSFYMSIGRKGAGKEKRNDGKTPIGTYFIDKRIDGQLLPDKYGDAAYPLNYPNAWDKIKGKTGHGIWLHGTAKNSYSRVPNATEGCISLANDDLKAIEQYIAQNTPIIIGNPVKWSSNRVAFNNAEFIKEFKVLNKDINKSMASNDVPVKVTNNTNIVAVKNDTLNGQLNNLSLINGPEKEMMIATFLQQLEDKVTRVEQYWKNTEKGWAVVSESRI